jgi:lipid-A-disaccharide synthase
MSRSPVRIAMVAGEPSGDLLASHLIAALKVHLPDAEFFGIGGPKMMAQGFDSWYPMETLSVHGYVEAMKHYRQILGVRNGLKKRLLAQPPDVFIGVDAPDFNLGLEKALKAQDIRAIHYVSPSIWAWRAGRLKDIVRSVDHLICLFPFEPALYEGKGIGVTYVGHPLADMIPATINRAALREKLGIPAARKVVALLPGSRNAELDYMAETYLLAAKRIDEQRPGTLFLVPLATRETRIKFEAAMYRLDLTELPIRLMFGHAQDALGAADVALVASGTATLEAALMKCPMVIAYKLARVSWWIMKHMSYLPYVGLPNVLGGRFVVPEYLQDAATPEALADALIGLLDDKEARAAMEAEFARQHEVLRLNTAERAATAVLSVMGRSGTQQAVDEAAVV